jgi:hypothetical protein
MNSRLTYCLIAAGLTISPVLAQNTAATSRERLQAAVYVVLPGVIQGNANLISKDQQVAMVAAIAHDSVNALKRRYPGAQIVSDANTPGAIKLIPVLVAPGALVPWASVGAQWTLKVPGQPDLTVKQNFNLFEAYSHKNETFNYMYDKVAGQLP